MATNKPKKGLNNQFSQQNSQMSSFQPIGSVNSNRFQK
jgi:hypothetical protein